MTDESKWRSLCESILREKNREKLWQLVEELNSILEERDIQLRRPERESGASWSVGRRPEPPV